jgi:hypothetical protein
MLRRLQNAFTTPLWPLYVAGITFLFCLPALGLGLQTDDYLIASEVICDGDVFTLWSDMSSFFADSMENGTFSWWTNPELTVSFFRPLSSLTHWIDFTLWPETAWLMHLINVLLYIGCVLVALLCYRRLLPNKSVAALVGLMFALDDAHPAAVSWIASRNTVLALLGSLSSLYFFIVANEKKSRWAMVASALCMLGALFSAEAGTWSIAFLAAYSLTLSSGSVSQRLSSLAPQIAVSAVWTFVYINNGAGIYGSSWYRPLDQPIYTLIQGVMDLPIAISSLLGFSAASFSIFNPEHTFRLAMIPVSLFCIWLVFPALRASTPQARFFLLALLFALLPTFLAVPQDRVYMGASFGGFGLIGICVWLSFERSTRLNTFRRRTFIGLHLILSPLLFLTAHRAQNAIVESNRMMADAVADSRETILLNSPTELHVFDTQFLVYYRSQCKQRSILHQLYSGGSGLWVERRDEHTLRVTANLGWGSTPFERIFCSRDALPQKGEKRLLHNLTVHVVESTADNRPRVADFIFPTPLESPERKWLIWQGKKAVPWTPPEIGKRLRVAPIPVFKAMTPQSEKVSAIIPMQMIEELGKIRRKIARQRCFQPGRSESLAPQLTVTKGFLRLGPAACRAAATCSFPVPVSPVINTVAILQCASTSLVSESHRRNPVA